MTEPTKQSSPEAQLPDTIPKAYKLPASSIKVDYFGEGLSDKTIKSFEELQNRSGTIGDFMMKMAFLGKRTGSVATVNFVKRSDTEYSVDFTRPAFYNIYSNSQGTNVNARVFGLVDYFDTTSVGVLFKIPAPKLEMGPLKFHSVFSYSLPFQIQDEKKVFRLSLYNMNAYLLKNQRTDYASSVVGAQLSTLQLGSLSAYAKMYAKNEQTTPIDKLIFRYYNRHFFAKNLNLDLKVSVGLSKQVKGQMLLYKDFVQYFRFQKAVTFLSNTSLLGLSTSDSLSVHSDQRIYDFTNSNYKGSNIFSVYSRCGIVNKVGPIVYTMYLFHSLTGHKKDHKMHTSVSYGLGNRLLLSKALAFELLMNFSNNENQAKIMSKILYFD